MGFNDRFRDRQAESATAAALSPRVGAAVEAIEDPAEVVVRNAFARVVDPHDRLISFPGQGHGDLPAGGGVMDGVVDQRAECLAQAVEIAADRDPTGNFLVQGLSGE